MHSVTLVHVPEASWVSLIQAAMRARPVQAALVALVALAAIPATSAIARPDTALSDTAPPAPEARVPANEHCEGKACSQTPGSAKSIQVILLSAVQTARNDCKDTKKLVFLTTTSKCANTLHTIPVVVDPDAVPATVAKPPTRREDPSSRMSDGGKKGSRIHQTTMRMGRRMTAVPV